MGATIADLEIKRFSIFGKHYVTHAYTNVSIRISAEENKLTDRGIVRKYFPNWREYF